MYLSPQARKLGRSPHRCTRVSKSWRALRARCRTFLNFSHGSASSATVVPRKTPATHVMNSWSAYAGSRSWRFVTDDGPRRPRRLARGSTNLRQPLLLIAHDARVSLRVATASANFLHFWVYLQWVEPCLEHGFVLSSAQEQICKGSATLSARE